MTGFHNPYHFIPLEPPPEDSLADADPLLEDGHLHDRWVEGHLSGRILCRLRTEGPLVVGGEQRRPDPDSATVVAPFELHAAGGDGETRRRPAIPGTTLRGLVCALVEAASCSALRVLGDHEFDRRAYPARGRQPIPGSVHDSVATVSPELPPFHPGRRRLTLAERLFGVVESRKGEGKESARALAGRVRFAHALAAGDEPEGGWYGEEVLLKILASPKPPCPPFYFGQHQPPLTKNHLDLRRHAPQGRKVYLHHRKEDVDAGGHATRVTGREHLRMRVRPLREGIDFLFHIDYENLTPEELGHLLYALRPTDRFRHKLGLGKPLGLGRVRIDRLLLGHRDRSGGLRAEALFAPAYRWAEVATERGEWPPLTGDLARRYRHELAATEATPGGDPEPTALAELSSAVRGRIPERVRHAIEQVGDPGEVRAEVSYPRLSTQRGEGEHFRWFVENDRAGPSRRRLEPLEPGKPLPVLPREPRR